VQRPRGRPTTKPRNLQTRTASPKGAFYNQSGRRRRRRRSSGGAEVMTAAAAAAAATATAVARPVLFLEDGDDEAEAHSDNAPGDDTADGRASVNDEAVEQQHQHSTGLLRIWQLVVGSSCSAWVFDHLRVGLRSSGAPLARHGRWILFVLTPGSQSRGV